MTTRLPGLVALCLTLASAASAQGVGQVAPSPAEWAWLTADRAPARSLAGRRSSWLDGAEVDLTSGVKLGVVDGFLFEAGGTVGAILVRAAPNGPTIAVPRNAIHVANAGRVVVSLTQEQALALAPVE